MYKTGDICPVCASGKLSGKVVTEKFEYKGNKFMIPNYHKFTCEHCKEELVSRKTILATEKVLTDYRRKVDGLLTSDEIKAIRHKLGKTQSEMAKFLDVGEKTFARYENGQVTQGKSMDKLLRVVNTHPSIINEMRNKPKYIEFDVVTSLDFNKKQSEMKYTVGNAKRDNSKIWGQELAA